MDTSVATTKYTFSNPRHQNLSLPFGFTNHIFKNYSSNIYSKLMQSCKYFFAKKRILLVENVELTFDAYFDGQKVTQYMTKMEAKKIKIWITGSLLSNNNYNDILKLSNLMNNLYQFDGMHLRVYQQEITLDEYMELATSRKLYDVTLTQSVVKNNDDSFVSAEDLLKHLYGVTRLNL